MVLHGMMSGRLLLCYRQQSHGESHRVGECSDHPLAAPASPVFATSPTDQLLQAATQRLVTEAVERIKSEQTSTESQP
jgi:hypothetical protein